MHRFKALQPRQLYGACTQALAESPLFEHIATAQSAIGFEYGRIYYDKKNEKHIILGYPATDTFAIQRTAPVTLFHVKNAMHILANRHHILPKNCVEYYPIAESNRRAHFILATVKPGEKTDDRVLQTIDSMRKYYDESLMREIFFSGVSVSGCPLGMEDPDSKEDAEPDLDPELRILLAGDRFNPIKLLPSEKRGTQRRGNIVDCGYHTYHSLMVELGVSDKAQSLTTLKKHEVLEHSRNGGASRQAQEDAKYAKSKQIGDDNAVGIDLITVHVEQKPSAPLSYLLERISTLEREHSFFPLGRATKAIKLNFLRELLYLNIKCELLLDPSAFTMDNDDVRIFVETFAKDWEEIKKGRHSRTTSFLRDTSNFLKNGDEVESEFFLIGDKDTGEAATANKSLFDIMDQLMTEEASKMKLTASPRS